MNWWVADAWRESPVLLVSWVVWVIGSIVLHELAHGWAAIRQGDDTPIETGHMTWNPLVHMGGMSLIVFLIFGFCWGLMPVNPSRMRSRHSDAIVSASGPAMNFALALGAAILGAIWLRYAKASVDPEVFRNFSLFFLVGSGINIFLGVFNLIPVPPLDGSRIIGSFFPAFGRLVNNPQATILALIVIIIAFRALGGSVQVLGFETGAKLTRLIAGALP